MNPELRNISLTMTLSAEQGDKVLVVERVIKPERHYATEMAEDAKSHVFDMLSELAAKASENEFSNHGSKHV